MLSICSDSRVKLQINKNNLHRITKTKPCISKYNWEGIHFSSEKHDWIKFEKNNVTIAINVLYAKKKKKIYPAYVWKHNSSCKRHFCVSMISSGEKCEAKSKGWEDKSEGHKTKSEWYEGEVQRTTTAVALSCIKKTSSIFKRNNFRISQWFLLLELPSFFCNRKKLESHKKVCENKDFCNIIMPSEHNKTLESNQYQKSDTAPFIIYADLECIIEKIDECKNNP